MQTSVVIIESAQSSYCARCCLCVRASATLRPDESSSLSVRPQTVARAVIQMLEGLLPLQKLIVFLPSPPSPPASLYVYVLPVPFVCSTTTGVVVKPRAELPPSTTLSTALSTAFAEDGRERCLPMEGVGRQGGAFLVVDGWDAQPSTAPAPVQCLSDGSPRPSCRHCNGQTDSMAALPSDKMETCFAAFR